MVTMTMTMMVTMVRMIAVMITSRKLGDTVPSWLELFLELVLMPAG